MKAMSSPAKIYTQYSMLCKSTHKLSRTQGSVSSFKRVSRFMRGQNGSCSN